LSARGALDELLDLGITRGIQAIGQGPSSENRRCTSMQRRAVLGPTGAFELAHGLKARSSGMAQPEWIEEPERYMISKDTPAVSKASRGLPVILNPTTQISEAIPRASGKAAPTTSTELIRKNNGLFSPS
jgi:hypothetical protein